MKKYLYCPICKEYPDSIYEITKFRISREWNGEEYETTEQEELESDGFFCGNCDTKLYGD